EQRRLARAVAPDEPDGAARLDREGDVAERPDVGAARVPPREEEILQRTALARVDAKAPCRMLDGDLARSHAADGTPSSRRTIVASVRTNAASSFGISIRSSASPS